MFTKLIVIVGGWKRRRKYYLCVCLRMCLLLWCSMVPCTKGMYACISFNMLCHATWLLIDVVAGQPRANYFYYMSITKYRHLILNVFNAYDVFIFPEIWFGGTWKELLITWAKPFRLNCCFFISVVLFLVISASN